MRWDRGHSSDDVDDRRDERPASAGMGGAPIAILFWLFSRFGLPGLLIGGVALYFLGGGLSFGGGGDDAPSTSLSSGEGKAQQDESVQFVSWVLDDVQNTWQKGLAQTGKPYRRARMVLFNGATQSACGLGQRAMGPFYCPSDQKVYLDLAFYNELRGRFGKTGDLAQAYVVAHEVGHHVQHLLGTDERVHNAPRSQLQGESSASVRLELQADCYAGIWANSAEGRKLLESGDLEGALKAAASIGDDRLQREATGTVQPEKWTHGSAAERSRWFKRGYELGSLEACDTFASERL
ncbi:MAG TPA: neutral zinc metallopeptidase [Polyangiales bacterium]|nr:neutral zinc metallopeptidase [Polyangiales bacterium]